MSALRPGATWTVRYLQSKPSRVVIKQAAEVDLRQGWCNFTEHHSRPGSLFMSLVCCLSSVGLGLVVPLLVGVTNQAAIAGIAAFAAPTLLFLLPAYRYTVTLSDDAFGVGCCAHAHAFTTHRIPPPPHDSQAVARIRAIEAQRDKEMQAVLEKEKANENRDYRYRTSCEYGIQM